MRLTREEFSNIRFMHQCVVKIPSIKANEITVGGVKIVIPDVADVEAEKDLYDKRILAGMAKKLASYAREDATKKSLRAEYIAMKEEVNKRKDDDKDTGEQRAARQATRHGILVKMPLSTKLLHGNMFSCDLDALVGDDVYWDGFWSTQEIKRLMGDSALDDSLIEVEDELYLRVPSVSLFAARRGDEYISLNGYVIASPIEEDKDYTTESSLLVPKEPSKVARAVVVAAPISKPVFRDEYFKTTEVSVGDVIITEPFYQLELDKTYSGDTKMVRVLLGVIMATE